MSNNRNPDYHLISNVIFIVMIQHQQKRHVLNVFHFYSLSVLWLPLSATKHDAGLRANWNISTSHPPESYRLQGQSTVISLFVLLKGVVMHFIFFK